MHCKHVCDAHTQHSDGSYVDSSAHAACSIHTLLTLLSGVWVPWRDASAAPTVQQRARRIDTAADSDEGRFVSAQIAKGVSQDLWEKLSPAQAADFGEASIIEAGFASLVGRLHLSPQEASVVHDDATRVDVPAINAQALARAEAFMALLTPPRAGLETPPVGKAAFAARWQAQGGGSKFRFCVAHNEFLNRGSDGWPLDFPTAHAVLETASPGDVFITRDHKSGYSVVPIREDQRRFFLFPRPRHRRRLQVQAPRFRLGPCPWHFLRFHGGTERYHL